MGLSTSAYIALAGIAASAVGTGVSYAASSASSKAAEAAQSQSIAAQNTAYESRIAAQNAQTAEQTSVQDQQQSQYLQEEQSMRSAQDTALSQEAAKVNQMNQESAAVAAASDAAKNQATQQDVTAQTLAQAQAASEAQRVAGTTQGVQDIRASNPLPSSGEGSATKSAVAEAMGKAADYTQQYSENLAKVGAYSAPIQTTNIATKELAGNLMPAAIADELLKAGATARLLPSQTAYSNATTQGKAAIDANTARTKDLMTLASTRATYAEDEANQYQSDTNANIQSALNVSQARDAATSSLGSGISSLGNAAITYGASTGGFKSLGSSLGNLFSGSSDVFSGNTMDAATRTAAASAGGNPFSGNTM
jgi:hypothetical protein